MKKLLFILLAMGVFVSFSGCQKIKRIFVKPPAEEMIQESYPIPVYAYESQVVLKATPQDFMNHILKDFSWFERAAKELGMLQMEMQDLKPDLDMSALGQSIDFNIKVLFINFPCRLVTIKYEPDKEVWLMILADGSWVLLRFKIKPMPEGSMLSFDGLIQPAPALQKIVDFSQLSEAVAARIDIIIGCIQSEFDPELDVRKATEKGLRGEFYQKFLQAHEASIRVNAGPDNVAQWIINNLDSCMSEVRIKGDCSSYKMFSEISEGQIRYCPGSLEFANLGVDTNNYLTWRTEGKAKLYSVYLQGLDRIAFYQFMVKPETGGSRVEVMVVIDIPGGTSPRMMDIMIALVNLPERMRKIIVDIKQGSEGVG